MKICKWCGEKTEYVFGGYCEWCKKNEKGQKPLGMEDK